MLINHEISPFQLGKIHIQKVGAYAFVVNTDFSFDRFIEKKIDFYFFIFYSSRAFSRSQQRTPQSRAKPLLIKCSAHCRNKFKHIMRCFFCSLSQDKSVFVGALRRLVLAKGEQPFGATRTPRLYGVGERTFLPIWFLPLRTPFSVKPFFCRHPLKLLRNTAHVLYFSRD